MLFRKEVVTKRSIFELNKALDRLHILEGLKIALEHIDEVIALIKQSKNAPEARTHLIDRFGFSEKQATSILEMRLQRLTNLEQAKILEDFETTSKEIARLQEILREERLLFDLVKKELLEIKDKYGDERQTEIIDLVPDISIEDMIKDEEVVVTYTHRGYIKRTPLDQYRAQLRGGKGKIGIVVRDEDFVDQLYTASTHSYILFFTNAGKAYSIKVHEIPGSRPVRQRETGDQPDQCGERRARNRHRSHAGVCRRQVPPPCDKKRAGEEDNLECLEPYTVLGHQGYKPP